MSTSASWSAGSLLRAEAAEKRTPVAREPKAAHVDSGTDPNNLCHGGTEPVADVYLVPDAVVSGSGGTASSERVEYHAEIAVRRGQGVGVAWTGEVVDDTGRVVQGNIVRGSDQVGAGDVAFTGAIRADMPNGFYVIQVRAAVAQPGRAVDMAVAQQHLLVDNGVWYEMSPEEWRAHSRVTVMQPSTQFRGGR